MRLNYYLQLIFIIKSQNNLFPYLHLNNVCLEKMATINYTKNKIYYLDTWPLDQYHIEAQTSDLYLEYLQSFHIFFQFQNLVHPPEIKENKKVDKFYKKQAT